MSLETSMEQNLRKFSILDFALVKLVYFCVSLMIIGLYAALADLSWIFYLVFCVIAAMPLYVHLFSQPGSYTAKLNAYLKTNTPATQVLLFMSVFFFAGFVGVLIPFLLSLQWWVYVVIAVVLAIKPLRVSWMW